MTIKEAKKKIDRTGIANLTLVNELDGFAFVGNVQSMTTHNGRVHLVWKLPEATHIAPFDRAFVHGHNQAYWSDYIKPIRLDNQTKKFELEWDL
jgi:hypothetical protein